MIYDTLALPAAAHIGRPVYKNRFTDPAVLHGSGAARLSPADRKLFDSVDRILWQYALKPGNTNLLPYEDEEKNYGEIEVLEVILRKAIPTARLAEIIFRAIPYSMLLFFRDGDRLSVSMEQLRKSRAEKNAMTVEDMTSLPWKEEEDPFWETMAYTSQRAGNFYDLYRGWYDAVSLARLDAAGGKTEGLTGDEAREVQRELESITARIGTLRKEMKKAGRFSEKAALNETLYALKERRKKLLRR